MGFIVGVVFLGVLVGVLYVWPAYAQPGKTLILAFGVALAALVLFWVSAYVGPIAMEEPRGLGAAIDLAFRGVASGYVVMAAVVQAIRRWAKSMDIGGYRHWIVVLLCAFLPPFLIVPFF
ncbi:hypothetical protein [Rhodophyticola porphyridii]|uniref:hypothetical protein n=1 Tax=Rhodophyticola porphyridii TaxID=1852017 RepID=UPI0011C3AAFC|nr:hypothetical protein [Rhodophyticola porphyridii]